MTPKTIQSLVFSILFMFVISFSQVSYAQDGTTWLEFSTKGHPQTTGHNFTLHYPPSYEKTLDFSKEDYLQTFVESDEKGSGDNYYYLTVSIHNLPNNILPSSLLPDGLWDFKNLDQFWNILAKKYHLLKLWIVLLVGVTYLWLDSQLVKSKMA